MNAPSLAACVCRNGSVQADMTNQDSNQVKQGGSSTEQIDKSGVTRIDVPGEGTAIVDADHVISTSSKTLIYLGEKSEGIDIIVEQEGSVVTGRSQEGQDALDAASGEESEGDTEDVDDAHAGCVDVQEGDVVTVRGEDRSDDPGPWKVESIEGDRIEDPEAKLWSSMQLPRREPVSDLTVVEKAKDRTLPHSVPDDDSDDSDEKTVMTDGGRDMDQSDDDLETVTVERPESICNAFNEESRSYFDVSVGDKVVLGRQLCSVTGVRETDNYGDHQDVEIDVESAPFTATVEGGLWECPDCDRVTADDRERPGQIMCTVCIVAEQRAKRRDSHRGETPGRKGRVREALDKDPAEHTIFVPKWRRELAEKAGEPIGDDNGGE